MIIYLRRMVKYLLVFALIFFLFLIVLPAVSANRSMSDSFMDIISNDRSRILLILILIMAFIYPVISFVKKERYLNGDFLKNREDIEKALSDLHYILLNEEGPKLVYRKKSGFMRMMYYWEDKIEIDISNNPILITGVRKEIKRLEKILDNYLLKE